MHLDYASLHLGRGLRPIIQKAISLPPVNCGSRCFSNCTTSSLRANKKSLAYFYARDENIPRYHPYSQGFKEDFGQLHFDLTRLHVTGYNCSRLRGSGGKFESVSELKAAYSRRLPLSGRKYISTMHHQCQNI